MVTTEVVRPVLAVAEGPVRKVDVLVIEVEDGRVPGGQEEVRG